MASADKPNILVIWGDDIGITNLSCYSDGLMGYRTPNIDRIADEGMRFTDSYGEQSCTAGRSSFITGQSVYRTGLSKVGIPAHGRRSAGRGPDDRRAAEAARLRDRAVRQEPPRRPQQVPADRARLRRVLRQPLPPERRGGAGAAELPASRRIPQLPRSLRPARRHPLLGDRRGRRHRGAALRPGRQAEDRGHRAARRRSAWRRSTTRSVAACNDFISRQQAADTPFFVWINTTHMHLRTHTKPESLGQAGRWQSPYHDTMIDHDKHVGALLDMLDELGIADDTIVVYSTDNGPHMNTWPDGGMTPFRSEKNTNWEGAFRVPEVIRWPGKIAAGSVSNEIVQHHDWLPTFLAAAGDADVVEKLKAGHEVGGKTFKVHIDGYNLLPYLTGEADKSPRQGFFYFNDDGDLVALRFDNWKVVFMEQRMQGTLRHLGGAVRAAARPEALQPAHRPLRARRHHLEHLLRLVHRPRLHRAGGDGDRDPVPGDVQGVPAAAEGSRASRSTRSSRNSRPSSRLGNEHVQAARLLERGVGQGGRARLRRARVRGSNQRCWHNRFNRAALLHTAMFIDQLTEGCTKRQVHNCQACAHGQIMKISSRRGYRCANRLVPLRAIRHDHRDIGKRFNIVDNGRLSIQTK